MLLVLARIGDPIVWLSELSGQREHIQIAISKLSCLGV